MGGRKPVAATAATATPSKTVIRVPRVMLYTLPGYSTTTFVPRAWRGGDHATSGRQVGKERALRRWGRRALAPSPLPPLGAFRFRLGRRALSLGASPALLMGYFVSLLDYHEIDEAGERIAEELEVPVPVAGRIGQGPHLLRGQHQRAAVTLPSGQPQLLQDARAADARRAGHATPSSRRMRRAASTREWSLATPTQRGVSQSPQSGTSQRRGAGMCWRARRTRAAISSGVSTWKALTSTTPTAISLSVGNSLQSPISLISRFAYSKTNWLTRASSRRG